MGGRLFQACDSHSPKDESKIICHIMCHCTSRWSWWWVPWCTKSKKNWLARMMCFQKMRGTAEWQMKGWCVPKRCEVLTQSYNGRDDVFPKGCEVAQNYNWRDDVFPKGCEKQQGITTGGCGTDWAGLDLCPCQRCEFTHSGDLPESLALRVVLCRR